MDIGAGKAGAVKGRSHLGSRVHAFFAQNGDLRARAFGDVRRGDILADVKAQRSRKPRIGVIGLGVKFFLGAPRVVAQRLHVPGRFRPGAAEARALLVDDVAAVAGDDDAIAVVYRA